MQVAGKVVVVTGGANGIGKALCETFHRAGAAKVVVVDLDLAGARSCRRRRSAALRSNATSDRKRTSCTSSRRPNGNFGPIALFCSNAGIGGGFDPMSVNAGGTSDEPWSQKLGDSRHGACLCRAASDPAHEGARRRLFPQHDLGGGPAVAGRQPGLFDDQTCRGGLCRKSRDLAPGRRHQGLDSVPAGRRHQHAARDPERPAIRRRRPDAGAGGAGRAERASSRKHS